MHLPTGGATSMSGGTFIDVLVGRAGGKVGPRGRAQCRCHAVLKVLSTALEAALCDLLQGSVAEDLLAFQVTDAGDQAGAWSRRYRAWPRLPSRRCAAVPANSHLFPPNCPSAIRHCALHEAV